MEFINLNNTHNSLKDIKYFEKDRELFSKLYPADKHNDKFKRVNRFNVADLQGRIIYTLLKRGITSDVIIANRENKEEINGIIDTLRSNMGWAYGLVNKVKTIVTKEPKPKAIDKSDLYPNINWDDSSDADVQMCMILYNDAVTSFNKLKDATDKVEKDPEKYSPRIVMHDERNRQAHAELQAYNDNKAFVYAHPLLAKRKQYNDLLDLKNNDLDAFMAEQKTAQDNIIRYKNLLSRKQYKDNVEKVNYEKLRDKHEEVLSLIKDILKKPNK